MDLGFVGSHELTIDAKGRVSIPADFRAKVQDEDPDFGEGSRARLVIVWGTERQNHFKLYTARAYKAIQKMIVSKPRGTPKRLLMERTFIANAGVVSLIEDGRIQLTQKMREKLGLTDKVVFIAETDKFLMYHPEVHAAETARIAAIEAAQAALLGPDVDFDAEYLLDEGQDPMPDLGIELD